MKIVRNAVLLLGLFFLAGCDTTTEDIQSETVSIEATGTHQDKVSIHPEGEITLGTEVTVTAAESDDYIFKHWLEGEEIVSESQSYTFEAQTDRQLTAVYISKASLVDVELQTNYEGTTVSKSITDGLIPGETLTISVEAPDDVHFSYWLNLDESSVFSKESTVTFDVMDDLRLKAIFFSEEYQALDESFPLEHYPLIYLREQDTPNTQDHHYVFWTLAPVDELFDFYKDVMDATFGLDDLETHMDSDYFYIIGKNNDWSIDVSLEGDMEVGSLKELYVYVRDYRPMPIPDADLVEPDTMFFSVLEEMVLVDYNAWNDDTYRYDYVLDNDLFGGIDTFDIDEYLHQSFTDEVTIQYIDMDEAFVSVGGHYDQNYFSMDIQRSDSYQDALAIRIWIEKASEYPDADLIDAEMDAIARYPDSRLIDTHESLQFFEETFRFVTLGDVETVKQHFMDALEAMDLTQELYYHTRNNATYLDAATEEQRFYIRIFHTSEFRDAIEYEVRLINRSLRPLPDEDYVDASDPDFLPRPEETMLFRYQGRDDRFYFASSFSVENIMNHYIELYEDDDKFRSLETMHYSDNEWEISFYHDDDFIRIHGYFDKHFIDATHFVVMIEDHTPEPFPETDVVDDDDIEKAPRYPGSILTAAYQDEDYYFARYYVVQSDMASLYDYALEHVFADEKWSIIEKHLSDNGFDVCAKSETGRICLYGDNRFSGYEDAIVYRINFENWAQPFPEDDLSDEPVPSFIDIDAAVLLWHSEWDGRTYSDYNFAIQMEKDAFWDYLIEEMLLEENGYEHVYAHDQDGVISFVSASYSTWELRVTVSETSHYENAIQYRVRVYDRSIPDEDLVTMPEHALLVRPSSLILTESHSWERVKELIFVTDAKLETIFDFYMDDAYAHLDDMERVAYEMHEHDGYIEYVYGDYTLQIYFHHEHDYLDAHAITVVLQDNTPKPMPEMDLAEPYGEEYGRIEGAYLIDAEGEDGIYYAHRYVIEMEREALVDYLMNAVFTSENGYGEPYKWSTWQDRVNIEVFLPGYRIVASVYGDTLYGDATEYTISVHDYSLPEDDLDAIIKHEHTLRYDDAVLLHQNEHDSSLRYTFGSYDSLETIFMFYEDYYMDADEYTLTQNNIYDASAHLRITAGVYEIHINLEQTGGGTVNIGFTIIDQTPEPLPEEDVMDPVGEVYGRLDDAVLLEANVAGDASWWTHIYGVPGEKEATIDAFMNTVFTEENGFSAPDKRDAWNNRVIIETYTGTYRVRVTIHDESGYVDATLYQVFVEDQSLPEDDQVEKESHEHLYRYPDAVLLEQYIDDRDRTYRFGSNDTIDSIYDYYVQLYSDDEAYEIEAHLDEGERGFIDVYVDDFTIHIQIHPSQAGHSEIFIDTFDASPEPMPESDLIDPKGEEYARIDGAYLLEAFEWETRYEHRYVAQMDQEAVVQALLDTVFTSENGFGEANEWTGWQDSTIIEAFHGNVRVRVTVFAESLYVDATQYRVYIEDHTLPEEDRVEKEPHDHIHRFPGAVLLDQYVGDHDTYYMFGSSDTLESISTYYENHFSESDDYTVANSNIQDMHADFRIETDAYTIYIFLQDIGIDVVYIEMSIEDNPQ